MRDIVELHEELKEKLGSWYETILLGLVAWWLASFDTSAFMLDYALSFSGR